ncbi:hypothetical protein JCM17380_30280 [Desulfosporosinus burensis]
MGSGLRYSLLGKCTLNDTLIDVVCKEAGVTREEVTRRTKIQKYSDVRKAIVKISEKYGSFTNIELSEKLNILIKVIAADEFAAPNVIT